ncbi:MAG: TolC family protein [Brotaphodocola sp.]
MNKKMVRQMVLSTVLTVSMVFPAQASSYNVGPGEESTKVVSEDVNGPAVGAAVECFVSGEAASDPASQEMSVTYENLEELLLSGNLDLKTRTDSLTGNKEKYQEMLETLRDEQDYMRFLADASEKGSEEESMYRMNAAMLGSSASRISGQIERLNSRSSAASLQNVIDTYLVTAQARYKSYKKMELNAAAKAKSTEAAERTWQETLKRQAAGLATADDVLRAADQYEQQKNLLSSYQQQTKEQRRQLLALLGLSSLDGDGAVAVADVSAPDLAAIDAIDFETDRQKAVNNNSNVQNERRSNAGTTYEIQRKAVTVAEAEGSAEASIVDTYQQLLAESSNYQAALDAYESAKISWNSVQLKKQAGMLDATAWLQGEAAWLQATADYQSASMDLVQAYEDYLWDVKGL